MDRVPPDPAMSGNRNLDSLFPKAVTLGLIDMLGVALATLVTSGNGYGVFAPPDA
jgi:hypothetical protein